MEITPAGTGVDLPPERGSYALELFLHQTTRLCAGRLGELVFPAGRYIYTGSAGGPGGLRARLNRHLYPATPHKMHWHIDYLRQVARPCALIILAGMPGAPGGMRLECAWSQLFQRMPGSRMPAPGFGASDCTAHCGAHLFLFEEPASRPLLSEPAVRCQMAARAGVEPERLQFYPLSLG